jgi:glucan 1,3-beta-glucosidase
VRNFIIDISDTTTDKAAGFHWQVAQATSMTNVQIFMTNTAGSSQMGLFTENGSGGFMSDCYISSGAYGICKCSARNESKLRDLINGYLVN